MNADDVVVQLITDNSDLTILSEPNSYNNEFTAGYQSEGQFIITVSEAANQGLINCNISITANSVTAYSNDIPFQIPIYFSQFGYPIYDKKVKNSPILFDLDGNSLSEIYFASDSLMYGTWVAGFDVTGFPFTADSEISTVSAVGDINGNGDKELVFGTSGGTLHALTDAGIEYLMYAQPDSIRNSPTLADLDLDGAYEIIFISGNANSSTLYVIDSEGQDYNGFPVDISERMISGPAVADLDNDSIIEIILTSTEGDIFVIDGSGSFKDGFPFETSGSLSYAASIGDLDGDQDLEIIAANLNGEIYAIHHDGSLMMNYSIGGPILSGISMADLDHNGQLELLFMAPESDQYNNPMVHAYDPINQSEISGWPISIGGLSYGELIVSDIDNDSDLEVLVTTLAGEIYIFHHDGSRYNNFPYSGEDSIKTTLSIGDMDNDDDFELIFGTENSLEVIDLQGSRGDRYSWNMFRGNLHRNGFFDASLGVLGTDENSLPTQFSISNNYPNPFNPVTHITYNIPKEVHINLSIYDILGRKVVTLKNGVETVGNKSISWNGLNTKGEIVGAGMYFYRFDAGDFKQTKKMILLK